MRLPKKFKRSIVSIHRNIYKENLKRLAEIEKEIEEAEKSEQPKKKRGRPRKKLQSPSKTDRNNEKKAKPV